MKDKDRIKCLDHYFHLRKLFTEGIKASSKFLTQEVGISRRTFYRYVKYMMKKDRMRIVYEKKRNIFWMKAKRRKRRTRKQKTKLK